jgi:hypothetical protein
MIAYMPQGSARRFEMTRHNRFESLLLLVAMAACESTTDTADTTPSDTQDTSSDADSDADADTDTDTDADADTDTDSDTGQLLGVKGRAGAATVSESSYVGTEELYFAPEEKTTERICSIVYDLNAVGSRWDCKECSWAFALRVSNAHVASETDPGCLATLGLDASTVDSLNGTVYGYGYNPLYYGHAQVLEVYQDAAWTVVTFASIDEKTGAFGYDWIVEREVPY